MKSYRQKIKILFFRLIVLIGLYFLCRLLFFLINQNQFSGASISEIFISFLVGLRFDLTVICWSNLLFILLSLFPESFFFKKGFQITLKTLYLLSNSVFLFFNSIDLAYYRFTNKRSGSDIFNQVFGGQTDIMKQIPDYFHDFWAVILFYFLQLFILFYSWSRIKWEKENQSNPTTTSDIFSSVLIFSLGACIALFGVRGGWTTLKISDAGKNVSPKLISVSLNTPFTIIKSMQSDRLEELNLVSNQEAQHYIKPIKHFKEKRFKKKNIVVFILEGFSKEFTGIGGRNSLTPFLDSLMKHSMVFTNAWANGKQSIEGVPAVISGVPSLMNNPYINSIYSRNKLNSFPQLLKKKGYKTAFFHGGKNGTMNFDNYAKIAGFDHYFGMNEYNNDKDFDGNWGIWDEPYLQYCVKEFSKLQAPFFASVFTLSSHHPFNVPSAYEGKFPNNGLEISPTIGYTDLALRKFFEAAKKMSWFNETWFVLVADHTGISSDPFYANSIGQHALPIIFYAPDNSFLGANKSLIQQIDILPSIMDTLGYDIPFFSFGESVFEKKENKFAIFYENGNYFLLNDTVSYVFNHHQPTHAYNFYKDSVLVKNILKKNAEGTNQVKSYYNNFFQLYHSTLNRNETFVK